MNSASRDPVECRDSQGGALAGIYPYFILGSLPLVLLAVGPNWIVSGLYNDPWIYFGYYLDLPAHLRIFDGLYYGNRLSVILPGYLCYRFLPPLAANLTLHLSLYYACVFSLHALLRRTASDRAALVTSILMGTNAFFLGSVGQDYVDGFGITYYFLSMILLFTSARSARWRISLFLAGLLGLAMTVAYLSFVILIPFTIVFFIVANRSGARHPLIRAAVWWLMGAGSLLVGFAILNRTWAGRWWFLGASFQFLREMANAPNYFLDRSMSWLPSAVWLATPFLAFACSLGALARRGRGSGNREPGLALFFSTQLVGLVVLFLIQDARGGGSLLQGWLYVSQLLPAAFLAIGSQLAPALGGLTARRYAAFIGGVVILSILPHGLIRAGFGLDFPRLAPIFLIVPGCLATAAALLVRPPSLAKSATFVALYTLVQFLAQSGFKQENSIVVLQKDPDFLRRGYLGKPPRDLRPFGERMRAYERDGFDVLLAIHDAVRNIQEVDPTGRTYFWFDFKEPDGVLFNNIACTYTWGERVLNLDFPSLNDRRKMDLSPFDARMKVVVLSNRADIADAAQLNLKREGYGSKVLAVKVVHRGSIEFTMTFLDLTRSDVQPESPSR